MTPLANRPTFPHVELPVSGHPGAFSQITTGGLSVREYYAGLAMQGILSNPRQYDDLIKALNVRFGPTEKAVKGTYTCAAMIAVEYADALIAELEKAQ